MAAVKNIKVLEKAIIAEILPFDNAVNSILEKVLKPTSKSASENSLFPRTAKVNTSEPASVNTETRGLDPIMDKIVVTAATPAINFRLILRSFFSFSVLDSP